ncbi:hypothetical protein ESCO_001955 [Escovopsis weberi]|uniref:Uncharacterized protein n=1 Tax=Escovopsis weberi TaxID=150374 RepID=A0A0M8MZK0_ESCWE|nr:hypothetical protein ESCO_001955 [Escovopsis weberi]
MFTKAVVVLAAAASLVSAAPQPTPVSSAPEAKRTFHWGLATVYNQFGAYGSCGQIHSDKDFIAAITPSWQGSGYPPKYCGRKMVVTNTGSNDGVGGAGKSTIVTIADTCPGCSTADSIDLSFGAWNYLTNNAPPGTFNVQWNFCNANGQC